MAEEPYATLKTNKGDIALRLFPYGAPQTVKNFIGLATGEKQWTNDGGRPTTEPLYNDTIFHRVIKGFMIQGGDPTGTGSGEPGYTIPDEIHPDLNFDAPYKLAMANNGKPDSNGCQFFITLAATPWLQNRHTIFGEVADDNSKKVVDAIAGTPVGPNDVPLEPLKILKAVVETR